MSFAMINLRVGQCMNLIGTVTDLSVFICFSVYLLRKSTVMYLFFSSIVIKKKVVEVCINLSNVTNIC
jgi:hypothetical protein